MTLLIDTNNSVTIYNSLLLFNSCHHVMMSAFCELQGFSFFFIIVGSRLTLICFCVSYWDSKKLLVTVFMSWLLKMVWKKIGVLALTPPLLLFLYAPGGWTVEAIRIILFYFSQRSVPAAKKNNCIKYSILNHDFTALMFILLQCFFLKFDKQDHLVESRIIFKIFEGSRRIEVLDHR